ncbi:MULTISPECIES: plasmid replication protein, CyRepA1 family [Burkholderia]|uniref:plasmid replication protein, CyRepA1 family n=1 Tax=Burkholderia TaxID=32008 RepID=UPI0016419B59|nr:plasmid replication protein, CyRepA1 family [Burkholderia gladioli]
MVSSKSNVVPPHQIAEVADGAQTPVSLPIPVSSIATVKVAINRHVKNKIARGDSIGWSHATYKFENLELAPDDFIADVASGYAFCAWLKGSRKSKNFLCMQVLAVDIDSGLTIEDVRAHPFFQKFGWFIYTTPSHQPDVHRFRIVFLMEQPIETEQRMKLVYTGIIRMFGGDRSCTDASRLFYGSEGCEVYHVDHVLPMEQVEYVIELGENVLHNDGRSLFDNRPSNSRSSVVLDDNEWIRTEEDGTYLLHELKRNTRVFCPRHLDRHASAFVVTSKAGQNGVYCSACVQTFWPKWNYRSHLDEYDFYSFEQELVEISYQEEQHPSEWLDDDAPAEYREMVDEKAVFTGNSEFLSGAGFPMLRDGVNFVRSPKGTGKTKWLEDAVQQYKEQGKTVLLIVHRQALASSLADRLKMHCYLDRLEDYVDRDEVRRYCVVCLDSLGHYLRPKWHKYDVVLIDESEQVYSHVLSSTLQGKRKPCFEKLHHYIRRAKQVVLSDADLGWLTFNVTALLRDDAGPGYFYVNRFRKNLDPTQPKHVVHLYSSDMQLIDHVIAVVGGGGKQYIACNSKDRAKTIKKILHERFGSERRIMIVTSDNSTTVEGRMFIKTIKETSADYDVLITSPAVSTGVDINIPDELPQFTHVFGFFGAGVNTHFEMDQQLARVRNMREQYVWISPARLCFEYEVDAVRQSILDRGSLPEVLKGYDWKGRPEYYENDKLIEVYAQVTSMSRASMNNVREHFVDLKMREGWEVHEVPQSDEEYDMLKKQYYGAKKQVAEDEFAEVASASRITSKKYRELQSKQTLTVDEKAQKARYQIEKFYDVTEVTPDLVRLDNRGAYRKCVEFYTLFVATELQRNTYALSQQGKSVVDRTDYVRKCALLKKLLRSAGVVDEYGTLDTFAEFESKTLDAFVAMVELHALDIGNILEVSVREDLWEKPMSQLSSLLKLIGLKTTKKAVNKGAKKIYQYRLDMDSIDLLEKYRERQAQNLYETRVHTNPITGDHMLIQQPAAKPMRFGNGAPKSGCEVIPIIPTDN